MTKQDRRKRMPRLIDGAGLLAVLVALVGLAVSAAPIGAQSQQHQRLYAQAIIVRPSGFEPAKLTRPATKILLFLENHSGIGELEFRLDRETGERLRVITTRGERLDLGEVVDLTPGRYFLTEANHPKWRCEITITPRQQAER